MPSALSLLPERQRDAFEFIERFYREKGFEPSMREVMEALSLKSKSTAHQHVLALERKGFVEARTVRGYRVYRPVDRAAA